MERISAAVVFCVVLIVGILLQAPPQVYKNVSSYYESFGKARTAPPAMTVQRTPLKKTRSRKQAPPKVEVQAASFLGEEAEATATGNDQEQPSANDPARP